MKYFIDTNIFLRFLVADESNVKASQECKRFFDQVESGKVSAVTASLVVAEIVWVLSGEYQFSKARIVEALRSLFAAGIALQDRNDVLKAVSLFEYTKAKFIDCMIASSDALQDDDTVLVSYDRDFDLLDVKRMEPGNIK